MAGSPNDESLNQFKIDGWYILHVCLPISHSFKKMYNSLAHFSPEVPDPESNTLSFKIKHTQLEAFSRTVLSVLNDHEMEDSRVLLIPVDDADADPIILLRHTMDLSRLVALSMSQWLLYLIENKQLLSWYQPIVEAKNRKVFAWEALLRAKSGNTVYGAPELLATARSSEILNFLDRESRIGAIKQADTYYPKLSRLFINFNPMSVYDPEVCLISTIKAVEETHYKPRDIVFEITENALAQKQHHLLDISRYYREQGYGVALEDIGAGLDLDNALTLTTELQPNYIKLAMELVRDIHTSSKQQMIVSRLVEQAQALDIQIIAKGIESEDEVSFLSTLPIGYYQGFHFSKPLAPSAIANGVELHY